MSPRFTSVLLAVAVAGALAGCGRRADLEQPAPLFGGRAAANTERAPAGPTSTGVGGASTPESETGEDDNTEFRRPREDRRDPSQQLQPASQTPIEGTTANDPVGAPPAVRP